MRRTLFELRTERLDMRRITIEDAPYLRALVTDPDWLRYIGDRGVKSDADAIDYMKRVLLPQYERNGFGFLAVIERASGAWIGLCGAIQRATLEHPDVGYAFLPSARGKGYARESAAAALNAAHDVLGFERVLAIVQPDNAASRRVLEHIGMRFDAIGPYGDPPEELAFYRSERGLLRSGGR